MDERVLLGRRIKEVRTSKGLSQERLAEKIDANWKYLSSIERGQENPTLDFMLKLAKGLDVEVVDLFNFVWQQLSERELRKQIKAMADRADLDALREIFAVMKSRGL